MESSGNINVICSWERTLSVVGRGCTYDPQRTTRFPRPKGSQKHFVGLIYKQRQVHIQLCARNTSWACKLHSRLSFNRGQVGKHFQRESLLLTVAQPVSSSMRPIKMQRAKRVNACLSIKSKCRVSCNRVRTATILARRTLIDKNTTAYFTHARLIKHRG